MHNILVINTGSSSIKFKLLCMPDEKYLGHGSVEQLDSNTARIKYRGADNSPTEIDRPCVTNSERLMALFELLSRNHAVETQHAPDAVSHRVVHGGNEFRHPVIVDSAVFARLEGISDLAPLHNQANLEGIRVARQHFPDAAQIAVFDTAFHHDLPDRARHYALPLELQREHKIRRYGFHGLSHHYVAEAAGRWLQRPVEQLRIISLHLGNGASACAIDSGRSIDTSMGFTPLEGLVMGSRCGDLDPSLPGYIEKRLALSDRELNELLNQRSGLTGLCGDRDMRRIEQRIQEGDAEARLAFDLYIYRIRKYIGAYIAALNGLDVLVFTGGIGENSGTVREAVCADMNALGISIDPGRNTRASDDITDISEPGAAVRVLVVATDEELEIARAAHACLTGATVTKMS